MTFQHPDVVMDTMWRDAKAAEDDCGVFAILDGARAPGIYDDVLRSGLKHRCLYSGEIPETLARVAPYLVQLDRDDPATRLLIHNCWGDSWGIFFTSTAYLEGLHRHFRRFLKVRDEKGNSLYFRYYDPRVLRSYLPTCDRSELLFVFGPVRSFFVEDEEPDSLLEFVVRDEKFITFRRPVVPVVGDHGDDHDHEDVHEHEHDHDHGDDHDHEHDHEHDTGEGGGWMDMVLEGGEEDTLVEAPMVVLPPPVEAEELSAEEPKLADVSAKKGEETLVATLDEVVGPGEQQADPRQALMDMPLDDPLGEGTLLVPADELFEGAGEPEDPESK